MVAPTSSGLPEPTSDDLLPLFKAARRVCSQRGYRVSDPDYDSAINLAVCKAWQTWTPNGARSLKALACHYALHQCVDVSREHEKWRRQDEAGACRGRESSEMRLYLPLPMEDFELLAFVAHHGRARAARLLGMRYYRLIALLDEVALRMDR